MYIKLKTSNKYPFFNLQRSNNLINLSVTTIKFYSAAVFYYKAIKQKSIYQN